MHYVLVVLRYTKGERQLFCGNPLTLRRLQYAGFRGGYTYHVPAHVDGGNEATECGALRQQLRQDTGSPRAKPRVSEVETGQTSRQQGLAQAAKRLHVRIGTPLGSIVHGRDH